MDASFVLDVRENKNLGRSVKVILDPSDPGSFKQSAWRKLHPHEPCDEHDLALLEGDAIVLEDEDSLKLLTVLSRNHLAATGRPLQIRIKSLAEEWFDEEDPGYIDVFPDGAGQSTSDAHNTSSKPKVAQRPCPHCSVSGFVVPSESYGNQSVVSTDIDAALAAAEQKKAKSSTLRQNTKSLASSNEIDVLAFGDIMKDLPSFLDDEAYNKKSDETDHEAMSDCIWWMKSSTRTVKFFETMTMVVIIVSVLGFVLETLPQYRLDENREPRTGDHPVFFLIESVCIAWFTIEYAMRFYAAGPARFTRWMWRPLNLVDLIAIIPYYIAFGIGSSGASSVAVVRILRLSRVTRLFKFSRHSSGLQDMLYCLGHTYNEMILFILIITVAGILFASAVFYCEDGTDSGFVSIPQGLWWAIITMTTVGYGDISPVTVAGKFVGALCASLGVVLLAIPAGIFISEFMRLHQERKLENNKFLKHEAALEKLRGMTEDFNIAVEVYAILRDEYDKKLKSYFSKKVDEARSNSSSSRGFLRKNSSLNASSLEERRTYVINEASEYDDFTLHHGHAFTKA